MDWHTASERWRLRDSLNAQAPASLEEQHRRERALQGMAGGLPANAASQGIVFLPDGRLGAATEYPGKADWGFADAANGLPSGWRSSEFQAGVAYDPDGVVHDWRAGIKHVRDGRGGCCCHGAFGAPSPLEHSGRRAELLSALLDRYNRQLHMRFELPISSPDGLMYRGRPVTDMTDAELEAAVADYERRRHAEDLKHWGRQYDACKQFDFVNEKSEPVPVEEVDSSWLGRFRAWRRRRRMARFLRLA